MGCAANEPPDQPGCIEFIAVSPYTNSQCMAHSLHEPGKFMY